MNISPSPSTIITKTAQVTGVADALVSGWTIIDVRSAAEFQCGTLPGAVNIPLFDEDERGIIGTIYRHGGHAQAVGEGFRIAEKKLADLLEAFHPLRGQPLTICCARGGMRSLAVANLLTQAGFSARQLTGGYKGYRRYVLNKLESFRPRLIVIHGLTGTGKTRVLNRLQRAIDLEELAGHRSSLFGGLDRPPNTQSIFESRLVERMATLGEEPYFIEGESRKIGRVFIPKPLALAMKEAILVRIDCRLETRISRIIEDYPVADEERLRQIEAIILSLKQKMGKERVEEMCVLLRQGRLADLVRILLLDYYDKRYGRSMSEYRYDLEISAEDIDEAATRLEEFRRSKVHSPAD